MKKRRRKISWPKIKSWFHLHKGTLMSIGAGAGVVAGSIVSSKEGVKAYKHLEEFKASEGREATGVEKAKIILKDHMGAITLGMGTIGLIASADSTNRKAIGALTGAYALLNQKYNAIKKSVEETHTPEETKNILESAIKNEHKLARLNPSDGVELWYEDHIGYFEATEGSVYKALASLNRSLKVSKCAIFADFVMDVTGMRAGDISPMWWSSGWSYEAMEAAWIYDEAIDITENVIIMDDGLKCRYISFSPGILADVCTNDGSLIYYIGSPD